MDNVLYKKMDNVLYKNMDNVLYKNVPYLPFFPIHMPHSGKTVARSHRQQFIYSMKLYFTVLFLAFD